LNHKNITHAVSEAEKEREKDTHRERERERERELERDRKKGRKTKKQQSKKRKPRFCGRSKCTILTYLKPPPKKWNIEEPSMAIE